MTPLSFRPSFARISVAVSCFFAGWLQCGAADMPQFAGLPIAFDIPQRVDRGSKVSSNGWGSRGKVDLRNPTGSERFIELEGSDEGRERPEIRVKFKAGNSLPSCALEFSWKVEQNPRETVVNATIEAPASRMSEKDERKALRESKRPLVVIGTSRCKNEQVKAFPTKEWTTLQVPFELGPDGISSLDQTFTVSLRLFTPNAKILVKDLKLIPATAFPKREK